MAHGAGLLPPSQAVGEGLVALVKGRAFGCPVPSTHPAMSRSATAPTIAGHGRTAILLPVPPPVWRGAPGSSCSRPAWPMRWRDRASTPVVVTRRTDGRAGQGVSTPTWMATVKAESDGRRRAGAPAVSTRRRRHLTAYCFSEAPPSKGGSGAQERTHPCRRDERAVSARRPGMTVRSLLMGLIDRQLSAVGRARRYGPRSRCTADDVVRWCCVVARWCHVGTARSPGPPDPCHLSKYL